MKGYLEKFENLMFAEVLVCVSEEFVIDVMQQSGVGHLNSNILLIFITNTCVGGKGVLGF